MSIKAVLFDLDGTLLPMDQDLFVKAYFKGLATKLAPHGYDPELLIKGVWAGTDAMIRNNGKKTNEEVFWDVFAGILGEKVRADELYFDEYYRTDFQKIKDVCGFVPQAAEVVRFLKKKGMRVALATNPLFPAIATESRIRWAGLTPEDFEIYTTYENNSYCKPNLDYYKAILECMELAPEDCLMVGNDVGEDMITRQLGMQVFLLTDCLINKANEDISIYPNGDFDALMEFVSAI